MSASRRRAITWAICCVAVSAPGELRAQVPAGTIYGIAVDSITGGPLRSAYVVLEGSAHNAVSDSLGRFVIPDVPPGRYRAVLLHELLDYLRLSVRTSDIVVPAGDTLHLVLSIPSPATVVRSRCPVRAGDADSAALFGVVTDVGGRQVHNATVLLNWRQITVSRDQGIGENEQHRASVTLPGGSFAICELPGDLVAQARVAAGADTSGVVTVRIAPSGLGIAELVLPATGRDPEQGAARDAGANDGSTSAPPADAVVTGRVVNSRGEPVAAASTWLGDPTHVVASDVSGRFTFATRPVGSQTLTVRRVGYELREIPLVLRPGETMELDIVMDDFVPLLDEVVVRATTDAALERVGFAPRARVGGGFYVHPGELERRGASRISDYLAGAPMLSVTGSGSNRRVTGRRQDTRTGCVTYAIDGQRWTGPPPDEHLNPEEIAAIEVYPRGLAPALFLGIDSCEVIIIWTKTRLGL
ncbi:MAG TPA: carboxypeptidase regulatory-like domain-containing protein [Gemmatimonadaceae bacterium]|nr:carboxypeptidase regulatory-like domain-containing protein [Gemmatimonadaceae bacterium]